MYQMPFLNTFVVEDCMKFQFLIQCNPISYLYAILSRFNGQCIHGLTRYATSPTYLYDWCFPSIHACLILSPRIPPNYVNFMPTRICKLRTYNLVHRFLVKLLSEIISYSVHLLRRLQELEQEYANRLLVYHVIVQTF